MEPTAKETITPLPVELTRTAAQATTVSLLWSDSHLDTERDNVSQDTDNDFLRSVLKIRTATVAITTATTTDRPTTIAALATLTTHLLVEARNKHYYQVSLDTSRVMS